ncbi:MAG: double-strand break repair protein AddB [Alphaproteobacteria bacterium]|nr:double-strand break repair protein AddB [Alphaproteobacteria bacterium]
MSAPRLFTIPIGAAFLDVLAAGLWDRVGRDPLALTEAEVLLPTRRAVRAAADAFLRLGDGRPMLLPKLSSIADVEEEELDLALGHETGVAEALDLPPAIPALRRQLQLTRLVFAYADRLKDDGVPAPRTPEQAVRLATALGRLIDQVQSERLDTTRLSALVPEEYAAHWGLTLRFLEIVTQAWPEVLAAQGVVDPVTRRDALMRAKAEAWRAQPPEAPVIIAGSTGSVPATAELMRTVLSLPGGAIVLPGVDLAMDDDAWAAVADDPAHPQHGMHRLLDKLDTLRGAIAPWRATADQTTPARVRLIGEAMRPAATTGAWQALTHDRDRPPVAEAFAGLRRIEAASPREEAGAIALLLREVVETPGRTAALVTPDRTLARRVASELTRWDLTVDDSGGTPLAHSAPATLLRLLAEAAVEQAAPVPLLALLKHRLTAGGMTVGAFRRQIRRLEREVLRGPRPASGFAGLRTAVERSGMAEAERAGLLVWLEDLSTRLDPVFAAVACDRVTVDEMAKVHLAAAEALAATDTKPGAAILWRGEAGTALARLFDALRDAADDLGPIRGREWPGLFEALLEGRVVHPSVDPHPRIHILGALEARLQRFDRVILGGLNEDTWPADPAPDPWMSRPMRQDFGLPPAERRIGLSAHDVVMAMGAPEVVLTRALRVDGTPTVPSRWLARLETVARALGDATAFAPWRAPLDWYAALDHPVRLEPGRPPAPCPPVAARPRQLSVTRIETWLRDPYSIYAARILTLDRLEELDAPPDAADRGQAIHAALDAFVRQYPRDLPPDALDRLLTIGQAAFEAHMDRPGVAAFWWPRFERVARWFIATERERRPALSVVHTEQRGRLVVDGPAGPFTLTGVADRIERSATGGWAIADYKTGSQPSKKDLETGRAPQLPLEALMLARGGFEGLSPAAVEALAYWRVGGGNPPGRIEAVKTDVATLIDEAEAGLRRLIEAFDDPATPYHAIPDGRRAPRFNDYDHLARVGEWAGEAEEG